MWLDRVAIVTMNYYGFGRTEDEARRNLIDAGGERNLKLYGYNLVEVEEPQHFAIGFMGNIRWSSGDPEVPAAKIKREVSTA